MKTTLRWSPGLRSRLPGLLVVLLAAGLLSGCGMRGDLYLPGPAAAETPAASAGQADDRAAETPPSQ